MTITLLTGDVRDVLPSLADASVHCVVTSPPYYALRSYLDASHPDKHRELGSEPTPDAYIAAMVAVFREVKRVLRPDGTCWVNMGDAYASTKVGNTNGTGASTLKADGRAEMSRLHSLSLTKTIGMDKPAVDHGLAAKQLLLMPARLALALQADGWWVRSDIIWAKPNPMPESCRDRCVSAHEHIFMLTKQPRYYFDADAIAEPAIHAGRVVDYDGTQKNCTAADAANDMRTRIQRPVEVGATRACRNVWTIPTHAYPAAHFATYPPELAERCIKAGTSERGCCAACGTPWQRITDKTYPPTDRTPAPNKGHIGVGFLGERAAGMTNGGFIPNREAVISTTGWSPSCTHEADVVPCTVLDPFAGASTTLLVAQQLQRDAIGIELNPEYVAMGRQRIEDEAGLFADVQTLDGAPADGLPESEAPGSPDHRSAYSDLGDAQSSLWEWDRELVPT